jgi:hypothetical protein
MRLGEAGASLDRHRRSPHRRSLLAGDGSRRIVGCMEDRVLLVSGAPVSAPRLDRVLYGPLRGLTTVFAVSADADPLGAIERALRSFSATRIVLAGTDASSDLTGDVEDRFGRPVMCVAAS